MDKSHADHAMGFHRTRRRTLSASTKDGGAIEVEVNDPKDADSIRQIRIHLQHIAHIFGEANFEIPILVPRPNTTGCARYETPGCGNQVHL
jgi:hypothetical protein